jgi:two-component system OmpR family response regulator
MKILLVEDDRETAANIVHTLESQGHEVELSLNGTDGAVRARGTFGAMILDRMLPEMDGLSLVRGLRAEGNHTPILLLTTMSGLDDRVEGLEGGADDYLAKPFAASELLARLHAITRRADMQASQEPAALRVGDLEMNLIRRVVTRGTQVIELQQQEFRLLEYLMRNAERVVTRAMLLENVWDLHFDPRTNIVETHMSRLRAKLEKARRGHMIHTIRGTGYILRAS